MDDALRQALHAGEQAGSRYALTPPRSTVAGRAGMQLAHMPGSSIEFMDHRQYQPGDDLRQLDWAAYARTDRLIVKRHRDEVSPHAELIVDGSRSMALSGTAKAGATVALAAAMAAAAGNAGFTHAAWLAGERIEPIGHGRERPTAWAGLTFTAPQTFSEALFAMPTTWRPRGIRVLLSDLLWPDEPLTMLQRLAHNASGVVVLQVLAAQDVEPPSQGNLRMVDSESGEVQDLFIDATARERYRKALFAHQGRWAQACRQVGAVMVSLVAERLLESWDLGELVQSGALRVV